MVLFICIYSTVFRKCCFAAFFLPGDSLLIMLGVFIERGILSFLITLISLTIATGLGSWVSYLQGKFLKNGKFFHCCLSFLSYRSYQKANYMLNKHGLIALFIGRFIAFIRTVLPMIAGVSELSAVRFQVYNWISAFIWVFMLIIIGFFLGRVISIFE